MDKLPYFIILLIVGLLCVITAYIKGQKFLVRLIDFSVVLLLILFVGLRGASKDFEEYVLMFNTIEGSTGESLLDRALIGKDILFGSFQLLISNAGLGFFGFILCTAILSIGLKVLAFEKAFKAWTVPLFAFVCTYLFLLDFTQIRVAVAIGFCFLAFVYVCDGSKYKYIFFMLLAIGFHAQTGVFLLITAPILLSHNNSSSFMMLAAVGLSLFIGVVMKYVVSMNMRAGLDIADGGFTVGATILPLIGFFLIYFSNKLMVSKFSNKLEKELSDKSVVLFFIGILFLFFTEHVSSAFAWRTAEMFMCFSVFVLVPALRSGMKSLAFFPALTFVSLYALVLLNGNLLLPYSFSSYI